MDLLDSRPLIYYTNHPEKNPYIHMVLTEPHSVNGPKLITGQRNIIT